MVRDQHTQPYKTGGKIIVFQFLTPIHVYKPKLSAQCSICILETASHDLDIAKNMSVQKMAFSRWFKEHK
jgi:hypothetical protein